MRGKGTFRNEAAGRARTVPARMGAASPCATGSCPGSDARRPLPDWQKREGLRSPAAKLTEIPGAPAAVLGTAPVIAIVLALSASFPGASALHASVLGPSVLGGRAVLESSEGKVETRELATLDCTDPRSLGAVIVRIEGLPPHAMPGSVVADDERAVVTLAGGDRLSGRVRGGRAELVDVEIAGGVRIGLAIDEIASVVFPSRIPAVGAVVPSPPKEGDRLYRRAGSGLDVLDGGVEEFTKEGVRIHGQSVGSKLVPWTEIAALYIEGVGGSAPKAPDPKAAKEAPKESSGKPQVSIDLADGGRLRGELERLSAEGCRLSTRNHEKVLVPIGALAQVVVEDGSIAFLSSYAPAEAPPSTPFGDDLGMRFETRLDRSVAGGTLTAGGKAFARGLGMHAPGRIRYKLDGSWKRLRGAVAVDDDTLRLASRGSVVFRVKVDGKVRFESLELHGGDPAVTFDQIDLSGAQELVLEADPSDGSSVADRADWLQMILSR